MNTHSNIDPAGRRRPLVALAGGKSGGHVFPALAVGEALESLGADVVFFGMAAGMEARLAQERGLRFEAIDAGALVGRGLLGKISALAKLSVNTWRARGRLRACGVVAVLGTGGFVSAPTVLGAKLAGLPIVLLEPNADPGAANRLLSRFADVTAVAFEQTSKQLRSPTMLTGVPIRSAFFDIDQPVNLDEPVNLLIVGGSQGAARLNQELPMAVVGALSSGSVTHQCGAHHLSETTDAWARALGVDATSPLSNGEPSAADLSTGAKLEKAGLTVEVVPFIAEMPRALKAASLVISRAGAITLAELSAAGRAAILIPLPLAGAHQLGNANRQAELGAAVVLEQDELAQCGDVLRNLLSSPQKLRQMGEAARAAARPDAALRIAEATRDAVRARGEERWAA